MKTYEIWNKLNAESVIVYADSLSEAQLAANRRFGPELGAWRIIPTAKQVRKTKNLMRGL